MLAVVTASNERTPETAFRVPRHECASGLSDLSDTAAVRLTDFWERMRTQFGSGYADSFARDYVLSELGGRTVVEALEQGEEAVTVWRAVCRTVEVEPNLR
jgi:hypothetical protein